MNDFLVELRPAASRLEHAPIQSGPAPVSRQARRLHTSTREVSAEDTLRRIQPLLPEFGINQVIDLTLPGVEACPVFQVIRDDVRSEFFNAGKGFTRVQSLVSGLMEAIEVHCYERSHPQLLLDREFLDSGAAAVQIGTLDSTRDTRFVAGFNHVTGAQVALPAEEVFREFEGRPTAASPNGIASGNSVNEALCHALGEMLERHALAGFFRQGSGGNHFSYQLLERVKPPPECDGIHACLDQLGAQDIGAEFIMISSAANVAVFVCFLDVPAGGDARGAIHGYGAHPDPRIAMARALGEAVQILALCPLLKETDQFQVADATAERVVMTSKQAAAIDPALIHGQRLADYSLLAQLKGSLDLIDYDYMAFHDQVAVTDEPQSTAQALQQLVHGLRELGFERIYSCVISPPDLPVVVVKTFCPGLDCIRGL